MKAAEGICVLTSSYPKWDKDFAGNFLHHLFKKLALTFQITVLAPGHWQSKGIEVMENVRVKRFNYFFPLKFQKLAYGDGISANLEKSFLSWLQIPFFFMSFVVNAFLTCKNKKFIWSHWILPSGLIGAILKYFTHKKHILTLHSSDVHFLNRLFFKKFLIRFIVKHTDVFTAVCHYTRSQFLDSLPPDMREHVKSRLSVLTLGIDQLRIVSKLEKQNLCSFYGFKEEKVVLYLGRLDPVKGLFDLIKAVKGLSRVLLAIAGEGSLKMDIDRYADKLRAKVKFTGAVDEQERFNLLALSDLVVVPSATLKNGRGEGLPVVILEAFAYGKPVIASEIGGVKEVVNNGYNGFIVPQRSPHLLRNKIKQLLEDEDLCRRLSQGAAQTGEHFKLEKIKDHYVHLLQKI